MGLHMSITSGNGIPSPIGGAGLTGALIILRMERGCLHPCSLGCASPNGRGNRPVFLVRLP